MSADEVRTRSAAAALPAKDDDTKVGRQVFRLRKRGQELQAKRPEYKALRVRIAVGEDAPDVTVTSSGREGAEAARRFLAELWK